jgi:hypothetical protein
MAQKLLPFYDMLSLAAQPHPPEVATNQVHLSEHTNVLVARGGAPLSSKLECTSAS